MSRVLTTLMQESILTGVSVHSSYQKDGVRHLGRFACALVSSAVFGRNFGRNLVERRISQRQGLSEHEVEMERLRRMTLVARETCVSVSLYPWPTKTFAGCNKNTHSRPRGRVSRWWFTNKFVARRTSACSSRYKLVAMSGPDWRYAKSWLVTSTAFTMDYVSLHGQRLQRRGRSTRVKG